jgi:hypothetical protein
VVSYACEGAGDIGFTCEFALAKESCFRVPAALTDLSLCLFQSMVSDPLLTKPGIRMPGHPAAKQLHGEVFWKCIAEQDPVRTTLFPLGPKLTIFAAHAHTSTLTQQSHGSENPCGLAEMVTAYPSARPIG